MYFVIADDGNKYGPADVATLNAWIAENRLQPTTILEDSQTMERRAAQNVPGLMFPNMSAGGPAMSGNTVRPEPSAPTGFSPGAYSAPGGVNSNYPRYDSAPSAEAQKLVTSAWIMGAIGIFCCGILPIFGIIRANKAKEMGHPQAQAALIFNIIALVIVCGSAGFQYTLISSRFGR